MLTGSAAAVTIHIDYSYDTNNFFDPASPDGLAARAALSAAADRYSCLLGSTLAAVPSRNPAYLFDGSWRIGFSHPGSGANFEISTSDSALTDPLVTVSGQPAADEYDNGFELPADRWILYPGGRSLAVAAEGGTGTGLNYTTVSNDPTGPHRRGATAIATLPVWGGSITFDNDGSTTWHFDHTTTGGTGTVDFYSVALHEVGHALGLASGWTDFDQWVDAGTGDYLGPAATSAYQSDNSSAGTLTVEDAAAGNNHWAEAMYQSLPHAACQPAGGVDLGALQNLIMEPILNHSAATPRFELTNVDVAALEDVGWQVVPEPASGILAFWALAGAGLLFRRPRRGR
jgi:hypothetical protein